MDMSTAMWIFLRLVFMYTPKAICCQMFYDLIAIRRRLIRNGMTRAVDLQEPGIKNELVVLPFCFLLCDLHLIALNAWPGRPALLVFSGRNDNYAMKEGVSRMCIQFFGDGSGSTFEGICFFFNLFCLFSSCFFFFATSR